MDSPTPRAHNDDPALSYAWGLYRSFAATARQQKSALTRWRWWMLLLTLLGAVFGTLCQQAIDWQPAWLTQLFGGLSAVTISFAAFFGKEFLNPDIERSWVRARSVAEALKSEVYRYLAQVPPYQGDEAGKGLLDRVQLLEDDNSDLMVLPLSADEKRKHLPQGPFSIDTYIQQRVREQVEGYYTPMAIKHLGILRKGNRSRLIFSGLAVLLGALGGLGLAWAGAISAWVAVLGVAATAVAAYLYAGRHSYLVISYQATARRLEGLLVRWQQCDQSEQARIRFIEDCEAAISVENSAWMAEWTKKEAG